MNKNDLAADLICVIAFAILLIMTFIAISKHLRQSYEINTGFFCALMCLAPLALRRGKAFRLPLALVVMIEVSIFLHAYGVLLKEYDLINNWDTVTHTVSSITVSLCTFYALMTAAVFDPRIKFTRSWMPFFIFFIAVTFGAYWESFEFAVDNLWGTKMQYSPFDTFGDLMCDVLGGVVVAIYSYIYLGRRTEKDFIEELNIHPRLRKIVKSRG